MSRAAIPVASIGNEFVLRRHQVDMAAPVVASEVAIDPVAVAPAVEATLAHQPRDFKPAS